MHLLTRLRHWFSKYPFLKHGALKYGFLKFRNRISPQPLGFSADDKSRPSVNVSAAQLSPAVARDVGVTITRVRLPSGAEIVIIERTVADE